MRPDEPRTAEEVLAIEEVDAWFEYLESTRPLVASSQYQEIESWAWSRLRQRLRDVERRREELNPAAV